MAASDDLKRVIRDIEKSLKRSVSSREMQRLGKMAIQIIQRRTRRGRGVSKSGGSVRTLKRLSPNYIAARKRQRRKLSRFTSPGKSNLTFTGKMLSSMQATVVKQGHVRIGFKGRRNEKVAEYVSKQRPFNNLARKEINALVEEFDKTFQAVLDRALRGS